MPVPRLALLLLLALAAPACAGTSATSGAGLPTLEGVDIQGRPFTLADHAGSDVVLLSFWATYCEPCKSEMPFLQRLHERYQVRGLTIVSVSLDGPDTQSGVVPYIRSNGYSFRVLVDEDTAIAQRWNPRATAPYTVLIDREGRIVEKIEGFQLSEADALEQKIVGLLGP